MTRLLLTIAMALLCALVTGCPGLVAPRDRTADTVPAAPPVADTVAVAPPAAEGAATGRPVVLPGAVGAATGTSVSSGALPTYIPVVGLKGKIISIGASTATNLVAHLAVDFRRMYPDVTLQVSASALSLGPTALLKDQADLVPMSRPLTPEEVQSFTRKYGYPPTEIKAAIDGLAIYVQKKNPVPGLTLTQLDGIFSQAQRRGGTSIETWGQVGLTGEWAGLQIALYGYGPEDGAHQIFRHQVLHDEPFRLALRVEGGGSSIVQGVAADPGAVGFASIFFDCKGVRGVPLAGADGRFYAPTKENIRSLNYPLVRAHYIYVNKPPRQPFGGAAGEFLRFLLSREGQQIVEAGGNISLDAAMVNEGRRSLGE